MEWQAHNCQGGVPPKLTSRSNTVLVHTLARLCMPHDRLICGKVPEQHRRHWTSRYRRLPSNSGNASENSEIPLPNEQEDEVRGCGGRGASAFTAGAPVTLAASVPTVHGAEHPHVPPTHPGVGPTETTGQGKGFCCCMDYEREKGTNQRVSR